MKARTIQLTLCWHLLLWRGGSRFAIGPMRAYDPDRARMRTVGVTLSMWRLTISLARLGPTVGLAIHDSWWRDFGGRLIGRWTVGGWRTGTSVPISTGWMRGGPRPYGISVTLASRTVYVMYLCSAAEYRPYWEAKRARKGKR
ncbi:hypothetical protein [Streptomyces tirandamycinicus]|uniref:Uncharacterized protein n=1 Tax=Streptomyces tirandamycinicus TaxID=2174846 RepID=A0A2S1T1X0_9ACTN|nr:hypothetical protein [Streptomyces tirandamycinicus]AWI32621.1 hypothetical protein DDW44_30340 [Streptomyces tirandamycinicus]